jgi:hypothetical protein
VSGQFYTTANAPARAQFQSADLLALDSRQELHNCFGRVGVGNSPPAPDKPGPPLPSANSARLLLHEHFPAPSLPWQVYEPLGRQPIYTGGSNMSSSTKAPDMVDDFERLRVSPDLAGLLRHYADAGVADPEAWLDRLMILEGANARDLTRLHGSLIASGWLEMNVAVPKFSQPGTIASCYRATLAGLRALRRLDKSSDAEDEALGEAA